MKTEEVNKKVIHYISDDGKDFGEDKAACTLYEFNNPYVKDIAKIPRLENILFFHTMIDAYWCESQEDIDLCCQYFQECKRQDNLKTNQRNEEMNYLDCLCSGRFIYPGYYFIMKLNSNTLDSYAMYSVEQMTNLWKVFLSQIPTDPEVQKRLEEINKVSEETFKSLNNNRIDNKDHPTTVKEIFETIKEKENNDINKDTTSSKKNIKIYRKENLNEYREDKKENEDNE